MMAKAKFCLDWRVASLAKNSLSFPLMSPVTTIFCDMAVIVVVGLVSNGGRVVVS